jgi:hypothetical protein
MPDTPNHLPTVERVRAQYPTNVDLGNKRAWMICNEVAWIHRGETFGLRRKDTGNNYVHEGIGYAIDIVFHKPTMQFVDILGSSETLGIPQWSEAPGAVLDEWMPPIDPATLDQPIPPIPPVPPSSLEARVEALELDLFRLKQALSGWIING